MTRYISCFFLLPLLFAVAEGRELSHSVMADNLKVALAPIQLNAASPHVVIPRVARTLLDDSSLLPFKRLTANDAALKQKTDGWLQASGIRFQKNLGQIIDTEGRTRSDIKYTSDVSATRLYFTHSGISTVFMKREGDQSGPRDFRDKEANAVMHTYRMDVEFVECNPDALIIAEDEVPGVNNFYYAYCPDGLLGVNEYHKLTYKNLWNNIDAVFYSVDGKYKYDFLVYPGGDPSSIQLRYEGAQKITMDREGAIHVETPLGSIVDHAPITYQHPESPITSTWQVEGSIVSFAVGKYDSTKPLIIDPWATYYGGSNNNYGFGIATDGSGNVIIDGETWSTGFPIQNAHQDSSGGDWDAFVVKFNSSGLLQWATYYGGSGWESCRLHGIATDGSGNVVMCGTTLSTDFPILPQQGSNAGGQDAFVVKFNGNGVRQWAKYYGGNDDDIATSIAVDGGGNVVITGWTESANFPVQNAQQASHAGGGEDAFIVKFSNSGVLQWATYYGGNVVDWAEDIAVDSSGNVIITGATNSTNLPVQNAQQEFLAARGDAFVVKFNSSGVIQWATYYGGSGDEIGYGVATDNNANVVLTGWTSSADFPVPYPHQGLYAGGTRDAYVVKFNSSGTVQWATYYGGTDTDSAFDITTDGNGNVVIAGSTTSTDFPVQNARQESYAGGSEDAFVVKFNSNGVRQWATYYGGSEYDEVESIGADGSGNVIICGITASTNFPITNAQQGSFAGGYDAFVVHLDSNGSPMVTVEGIERTKTVEFSQNHPNPFQSATMISFSLPNAQSIRLSIIDPSGRKLGTLVEEFSSAGWHFVPFHANDLPSGAYTIVLEHGSGILTRTMVLVR